MTLMRLMRLIEMIERRRLLVENEESELEWVVVYHLGYSDFDDEIDNSDIHEAVLNAPDFDTAVRYAQQYLRKMQTEEETASEWSSAQILSVELR